MGSVEIVAVEPAGQPRTAVQGRAIGLAVRPFPQQRLNEALGLAVRARRVGAREEVPRAEGLAHAGESVRAVCRAVIGHDPLDADTQPGPPRGGPAQEAAGRGISLVGQDLDVGGPRGVIDTDMDVFPANAPRARPPIACQRSSNNPHLWSLKIPHPS